MKKVILYGVSGAMGKVLVEEIRKSESFELLCGVSPLKTQEDEDYAIVPSLSQIKERADLLIDFSHPDNLKDIIAYSSRYKTPTLIATTGFNEEETEMIIACGSDFPILLSTNTSFGINLLRKVLFEVSALFEDSFDIEVIEKHHNRKIDAPSGTANTLVSSIEDSLSSDRKRIYGRGPQSPKRDRSEIGIHSIRGGSYPGEHTVIFAGDDEIIEFKHIALSKKIFASGALKAGLLLMEKDPGFYQMKDIY